MIIGVSLELPEITLKLIEGAIKKWRKFDTWMLSKRKIKELYDLLKKHEFWIDGVALVAWIIIVLGLMVELGANQRARAIQGAEFAKTTIDASKANERTVMQVYTNILLSARFEELRKDNLTLESQLAWRTITPRQEAILTNLLRPVFQANYPLTNVVKVNVNVEQTDFEARWYAKRIADVLRECGFDVEFQPKLFFPDPKEPIPVGLGILANGINSVRILGAFKAAGIKLAYEQSDTNARSEALDILVWHKPEK